MKTNMLMTVDQNRPASVSGSTATPYLVDVSLLMVILAGFAGTIKMILPTLVGTFQTRQEAKLEAEKQLRQAEITQDIATQNALHKVYEAMAQSSNEQSTLLTKTLVERVIKSLDELSTTQKTLTEQTAMIAKTQQSIANTQQRTLEVLLIVEQKLGIDKSDTVSTQSDLSQYCE